MIFSLHFCPNISLAFEGALNGIQIVNVKQQVERTYNQIPIIKKRIEILQNIGVTNTVNEEIKDTLGVTISEYISNQPKAENQWVLYNYLTYYISHIIEMRLRAAYQLKVSKIFQL